jgi:Domain of unknown function (DUF3786)
MQERKRNETSETKDPMSEKIKVPPQYWEDLKNEDLNRLCSRLHVVAFPPNGFILSILGREILVDRSEACIKSRKSASWEKIDHPLLELLVLVYFLNAGPDPVKNEMIGVQELKYSHFFRGPHEFRLEPLLARYGFDPKGFKDAAEFLGGQPINLSDISYRIPALPKVPLYYLFWEGDEEFEPRISVLFDRSVENHLSADAIWGLVNLVSDALLKAPTAPF